MDNYTITGRIGEGAHGLVLKAIHNSTGNNVAIKKVSLKRIDDGIPSSIIREIKTLQELDHPYIIKLLDAFPSSFDFCMIFNFMPSGLWELLKDNERPLTYSQKKRYMIMLLEGVAYMHKQNIMHRDLKPANLLIDSNGILKIADFGLARLMFEEYNTRPYSHQVATRWYRAPELLYGSRIYTSSIDMWSIGCIIAEIINNSPLFPGETDIEQLAIVLRHLGTPTVETWPDLISLPDYNKITFPYQKGIEWEDIVPDAGTDGLEFLKNILLYDSSMRLTANEALKHKFFYTQPYPCLIQNLPKPADDHRSQLRPKEVDPTIRATSIFKDLLKLT
ncbi:hypothetical protein HCN44_009445 [Aphidius gifuensis]|uniref:Cyclin-dependent kinase 20 n=1 Tax=Aphidius gifuensis TaxID=684658 RepID=A0A834Y7E1_APHGI|nr:cyclin-dependent kinase 20-like [Aphidius gifuensis]KAF7998047.1 hypothetical protein HCN44_009445 [Aphidius gifuensis]